MIYCNSYVLIPLSSLLAYKFQEKLKHLLNSVCRTKKMSLIDEIKIIIGLNKAIERIVMNTFNCFSKKLNDTFGHLIR